MIRSAANLPPPGLAPDEAASFWFVRMDAGPLDASAVAAFEAWRDASQANADAMDRARETWNLFDGAAGDPHLEALRESALAAGPDRPRKLWFGFGAAIAASLVAATFLGTNFLTFGPEQHLRPPIAQAAIGPVTQSQKPDRGDFATAKGEQRTVELADGSTVTLNTDSAVRVAFAPDRRVIKVLRGQVLFEVAKNRARPFVVQAGDRQVTALGTVFEVRLDRNRMRVTLIEGKVVVDGVDSKPAGGAVIVPTVLAPGEELVAMLGPMQTLGKIDIDQHMRWREGYVEFSDVTLADAVREMNRYSDRQLVLSSPRIASLRVSGIFRTGNSERFVGIVGEMLPVRGRKQPDGTIELIGLERNVP